jgi:hypothetical protein
MTDAERKILAVLDVIKAHWDLHPKQGYSTRAGGGYSYRHSPGQMDISIQKIRDESKVSYEELTPILHKLQEEGFFQKVEMFGDYE